MKPASISSTRRESLTGADQSSSVEEDLQALLEETGIDIVVYTQEKGPRSARARGPRDEAAALLAEWGVGGEDGTGAVMFWNTNEDGSITRSGVALGSDFSTVLAPEIDESVNGVVQTGLRAEGLA